MADRAPSLQDLFLNECRRSKASMTIFLVKGVKLTGNITWFDNFSLLLRRDGASQLIYKHAISTISPAVPLQLADLPQGGEGKGKASLQDRFLDAAEKAGETMTLFLMNGVVLPGEVAAHDQFAILLTRAGMGQLVYKHAISTLQPSGPLDLGSGDEQ